MGSILAWNAQLSESKNRHIHIACAFAFGLGTAIRFANLAKGLDHMSWLPKKWQTWLCPPRQH
jgi:hypothetical protein